MNTSLTPDHPLVNAGTILSLGVRQAKELTYSQYIVTTTFDITDYLTAIRKDGHVKSEDVFTKLSEALIAAKVVVPVESCSLEIGELGRPSGALQEYYKYSLNDSDWVARDLVDELARSYFSFNGPEGDLHLLQIGEGLTVGQADIYIEVMGGTPKKCTLDIVGTNDAAWPDGLSNEIKAEVSSMLHRLHPDALFDIKVLIRRSDLAIATESLLAKC